MVAKRSWWLKLTSTFLQNPGFDPGLFKRGKWDINRNFDKQGCLKVVIIILQLRCIMPTPLWLTIIPRCQILHKNFQYNLKWLPNDYILYKSNEMKQNLRTYNFIYFYKCCEYTYVLYTSIVLTFRYINKHINLSLIKNT